MTPSSLEQVRSALGAEYDVLRLLGQGGMAAVYLARERALKRLVAIKVLDPELGVSSVFRARFQLEAETAAQLQHPNIVPIFRVGQTGGLTYFTMGYVEGESLAELLKASGRLPLDDVIRIGREVAAALGCAHRRGIVHRDVKPQNVLIERETGRAMVTDFGIARVVAEGVSGADGEQLTGFGMVMGTPRYMSPEQASGARDLGPASDLYSLGVILYEAIAGAYPYKFGSTPNYMVAHVAQSPIPLVARIGDIPRDIEAVVHRLLSKEPEDRFASADDVAAALAGGRTAELRQLQRPERRPSAPGLIRSRTALVLAVLALAIGGLALATSRSGALPDGVDPRRSILVGFFTNTRQDPELDWLRVGGVELLAQSLGRWQDLQVVDAERLLDLARRAELGDGAQLSQADVVGLAREAGVWTATTGAILPLGRDSITLTVKVYDVAAEKLLATASAAAPADADLTPAFKSLADQILRVAGVPRGALADVEPPTRSIAAYRAYVEGIEARSRWDLDRAQDAFSRAIASDSTFALALYELSQIKFGREFLTPSDSFVVLADRAFRLASGRPPKERLLLTGYHHIVHARFREAKQTFRELLARDSTIGDAWAGLAAAEQYDLTLERDARGRDRLPASYTTALAAYRRALALDGSDHRLYANLAAMLAQVSFDDADYRIPGFSDPPPGDVRTVSYRRAKSWFVPLLVDTAVMLVPAESLSRYRPATLDSLRASARRQAMEVVRQWLGVAPDEGLAHLLLVNLHRAEGRYDEALVSLREAERLEAATPIPFLIYRLWLLLDAGRLQQAADLADSVASVPALSDSLTRDAALVTPALANALLLGGRPAEAEQLVRARARAMQARGIPQSIQRFYDLSLAGFPLSVRTGAGTVSRAELAQAMAEMSRVSAAAPDSERTSLDEAMANQVLMAAATLGDTALVRTWMARRTGPPRAGYGAWAAAVAGDAASAQRLLAIAIRDTARAPRHVWSMARAAELLGRQADAVRLYAELDTLRYSTIETVSADWILRVRGQAALGGLLENAGDTAGARRAYKRVLTLWREADPMLLPERDAVQRALTELDRSDRGDGTQ